jgi:hypothetical protein
MFNPGALKIQRVGLLVAVIRVAGQAEAVGATAPPQRRLSPQTLHSRINDTTR